MRKTLTWALVLALGIALGAFGTQALNAQQQSAVSPIGVDSKGLHSTIKFEQVLSGYLTDANGKYKLRVSETQLEPGGYVAEHQHRGPGIRFVTAGEQTVVEAGKSTVYKVGDYYLEPGNVTNAAYNKGKVPLTFVSFELLPTDLKGGSSFVPLK
jgi:quercetin dioxygenase-like cupin family protein